jgi:dienelactone hydrolase
MKRLQLSVFTIFFFILIGCDKIPSTAGKPADEPATAVSPTEMQSTQGKNIELPSERITTNESPSETEAPLEHPLVSEKPIEGVDFVSTSNYANSRLEFYYYIPPKVLKNEQQANPALICIPPLSGRGEGFVSPVIKDFANEEGFIIIAPSFVWDQNNWAAKTSYQYPEAWSGYALLDIIDKVKSAHGLSISKLYLYGFSAGAQFATRFSLWRPNLCVACAAHAGGGTIDVRDKVYVKFFVSVGRDDAERIPKVEAFVNTAQRLGIEVAYRQYDGGHNLPPQQIQDSLRFFRDVKTSQY